jgi:predicted unusual protein kinase regulating ubiquinone biosynthesis (AarF/ABC1/UbiB family)
VRKARYRQIVVFFARALLGLVFWELLAPRLGLGGRVERTRSLRLRTLAIRFRALALRMGGVLIKVGQFLSSRHDVLPEEITSELKWLQDEVTAERFGDIRAIAEAELGAPLSERFASFDETPLGAASLGQVHRATLSREAAASGPTDVVVKVQRPNIDALIETDLAALRTVGGWLARYPPIRRRADVPALLAEFTRVLHEEIDYEAEGRNAETFARQFASRPGVRVPRVVWSHSTRRVLTLEDVFGIKLTDHAALDAAGIDRKALAGRFYDTYLQQLFTHGFFHADPHPGNLFVVKTASGFELRFVDFGMVGRVTPATRAGLRAAAIALATRDAGGLVRSAQQLGMLLPGADVALLERVMARLLDRFWGKAVSELNKVSLGELQEVVGELRALLYTMPFQVPQDLILLGRTVGIISGMCAAIHPDFDPWPHFMPFARRLVAEEAPSVLGGYVEKLGDVVRTLFAVPKQAESLLTRMEKGEMVLRVPELEARTERVEIALRQLTGGVVFAAFLVTGVALHVAGKPWPGSMLLLGAALSLGWVLLLASRRR